MEEKIRLTLEEKKANWEKTKQEIRRQVVIIAGETKGDAFMRYFAHKYDKFNRNLLDWRMCLLLFDDYHYCHRVGTRWYACVGTGGTGKSTLMQNVFYFLDGTFSIDQANMSVPNFINRLADLLSNHKKKIKYKALFMDEPDDDIHPQTDLGKRFRKVLGKARQAKFFFGICATDMNDIPPYIFRKMDTVFFLPKLGRSMIIRNSGKSANDKDYMLQHLRKEYQHRGYRVFFELKKDYNPLECWTGCQLPFSIQEKNVYLNNKWDDFKKDVLDLNKALKDTSSKGGINAKRTIKLYDRNVTVYNLRKRGLSWEEIAIILESPRATIAAAHATWLAEKRFNVAGRSGGGGN